MFGLNWTTAIWAFVVLCAAIGMAVAVRFNTPAIDEIILYDIGWTVTILCVLMCIGAAPFLKNNFTLYTAVILLACAWSLVLTTYVLPCYKCRTSPEIRLIRLAQDIGNVLMVYVGGLLHAHVQMKRVGDPLSVSVELYFPLGLIVLIVMPSMIHGIELPPTFVELLQSMGLSVDKNEISRLVVELFIGQLLNVVGFAWIARGVYAINGDSLALRLLVVVLVCYASATISRAIQLIPELSEPPSFYVLSVAAAKFAVTVFFIHALITYNRRTAVPTLSPVIQALWDMQRTVLKVLVKQGTIQSADLCPEMRASREAHQKAATAFPAAASSQATADAIGSLMTELGCP